MVSSQGRRDRGLATHQKVRDLLEDVDDFAGGLALVDGVDLGRHVG